MRRNNSKKKLLGSKYSVHTKHVLGSVLLATGATGGWFGLVRAREDGAIDVLPWLGLLIMALSIGSMLCIVVPLIRQEEAHGVREAMANGGIAKARAGEYIAKYSMKDKVLVVMLSIILGGLTFFVILRTHRPIGQMLCTALFLLVGGYAIRVNTSSVRFTKDRIL